VLNTENFTVWLTLNHTNCQKNLPTNIENLKSCVFNQRLGLEKAIEDYDLLSGLYGECKQSLEKYKNKICNLKGGVARLKSEIFENTQSKQIESLVKENNYLLGNHNISIEQDFASEQDFEMLKKNYDKMIEGTEVAFNSLNQLLTDTYDSRNQNSPDPGFDFYQMLTKITEVKDSFRTKIESMQDSRQSLVNKKSPNDTNCQANASQHPSIPFPEYICQSPPLEPLQPQPIPDYDKNILHLTDCTNPTRETPGFNSRNREYLLANHGELMTTINSAHQESSEYLEGLYTLGRKVYNRTEYKTIRDEDIIPITPIVKSHVSTLGLKKIYRRV
jgi:hypothetical protein